MKANFLKILPILLFLNACGAFKSIPTTRSIASVTDTQETIVLDIEDKLLQIHLYYVIGQKQLMLFDEQIDSTEMDKIYERPVYLKLQAVRAQVEELEHDIIAIVESLETDKDTHTIQKKKLAVIAKISQFAKKSHIHAYSIENLKSHLNIKIENQLKALSKTEIESEISFLSSTTQYQVFEKNIEHLSYMLESRTSETSKRFYPSSSKAGNITGNEFPSKVWSLTFDDGPKAETSSRILDELKKHHLKATFFQLTKQAQANPVISHKIRSEGMEIASHSFSHKQLTKVGAGAQEKEITVAVKELQKLHRTEIKFFRLPYGAGVSTPNIRERIADNGLIHVSSNVDTIDWMAQTPAKIVARTIALMKKTPHDAGIVIFHDIHQRTAEALPQIMDYLKQDNRRVCTLNEIVTQMNERSQTVCPQK